MSIHVGNPIYLEQTNTIRLMNKLNEKPYDGRFAELLRKEMNNNEANVAYCKDDAGGFFHGIV